MATSEVADVLTMVDCILEANVYGVKVEGRYRVVIRFSPKCDALYYCNCNIVLIIVSRP